MHLEFAQLSTVQFLPSSIPCTPDSPSFAVIKKIFINIFYFPAIIYIFSVYSSAQMFGSFLMS